MFHPMVAGVTIPGMGLILLILAPYMDRNPSIKPEDRKFTISVFTIFMMFWAVLVIIGSFFRGPGQNFVLPVERPASSSSCEVSGDERWQPSHRHRRGARARSRSRCSSSPPGATTPVAARGRSRARRASAIARAAPTRRCEVPPAPTGREVELAAVAAERSTELEKAAPSLPVPYVPPDPETIGVTRRQFFNRGLVAAHLSRPGRLRRRGRRLPVERPQGRLRRRRSPSASSTTSRPGSRQNQGFYYVPEARAWMTEYPAEALPKAEAVYAGPVLVGMKAGINALYQKCPHLGCRVPQCDSSQWFECPCHGSQYNRVGEKKGGPAPRGHGPLRRRPSAPANVTIDTGAIFQGPPIGTNTTGQEAEGPHCVTGGE